MARTLLVLGNGFDLKVGLKSSFQHFLASEYYAPVIKRIKEAFEIVRKEIRIHYTSYRIIPNELYLLFEEINFWDLYYGVPHIYGFSDVYNWYNFERKLQSFLSSIGIEFGEVDDIKKTTWEVAQDDIKKGHINEERCLYKLLLNQYLEKYNVIKEHHYDLLLSELKEYEIRFGEYIELQQRELAVYTKEAQNLISELLEDNDELVYINTFNYTKLSKVKPAKCEIWHVNGDIKHPIFGIDCAETNVTYSKYSFSKTYRRLELEGDNSYYPKRKEFTKVVVFGHSLNRQDYNYFYALFNQLNLSNDRGKRNGYTVEFAYSAHSQKEPEAVRRETIQNVLSLLAGYNKDVLHEEQFRLMDILYCNGAIKFKEIS